MAQDIAKKITMKTIHKLFIDALVIISFITFAFVMVASLIILTKLFI